MRAMTINRFGGPEELQLQDLPIPEIKPGEVLIRVKACGVGLWDIKEQENQLGLGEARLPFPIISGWECAGIIAGVGQAVTDFAISDEVIAYAYQRGCYAEYVAVDVASVARKPVSISFEESAALPVCGVTAHQAIFEELKLKPTETILITGGSGGTGSLAVQLAAKVGARVIATTSRLNHDFVKNLGAQAVIDYDTTDFVTAIRESYPSGINLVLNCVSNENNFVRCLHTLRPGGRIGSIVAWSEQEIIPPNISATYIIGRPDGKRLQTLAHLIRGGQLKVQLQQVLPLEEAFQAQKLVQGGHTRGKIVLTVS